MSKEQMKTAQTPQVNGDLAVRKSSLHGLGCFAKVKFLKNTQIAAYTGERITHTEAISRLVGANGKHISQLDVDHYIDGRIGGNETQYINHSCEPNADVVISDGVMIVVALREIRAGEEVTVDYLNSFDQDQASCRCRTTSCRNMQVPENDLE
jgi:SET domain-containing protein